MSVEISRLRVEHYQSPLGISESQPRLSWRFKGDAENWVQKSYKLRIRRDHNSEEYVIESSDSVLVPWPSTPLKSREHVQVEVESHGSDSSIAAAKTDLEVGLLEKHDWKAEMVSGPLEDAERPKRPIRMCCRFKSGKGPARLYITAHGLYEAYLNGKRIGDDYLAPGWTTYDANLHYAAHDVTPLMNDGENVLSAWVAEGWFCGRVGQFERRNKWGLRMGLLAQLEVEGKVVCATGKDWEWSYGALTGAEIYDGETYDSTIDDAQWHTGNDKSEWEPTVVQSFPSSTLATTQSPPIREYARLKAKKLVMTPSGKTVIDFGQNFAGWVEFQSEHPSSEGTLVLRHAEVLEHGELGVRPLRAAKATDTIRLGGKIKGWHPRFTFHGFRYLEVNGWPGITLDDVVGVALSSDMERTGDFECSHNIINQLYANVFWSTRSNTISLPTDCPQRAERLGWTGDIQVFAPTMGYMFDTAGFLSSWLKDLWAEQQKWPDKRVPLVIPDVFEELGAKSQAIWGDVAVLLPWDQWMIYGDKHMLADQYESMATWLSTGIKRDPQTNMWAEDHPQFADWLAPAAKPGTPAIGPTDNRLVANAYLIHTTRVAGRIAQLLGDNKQAKFCEAEAEELLQTFHETYVTRRSRVVSDTQTALSLILQFNLTDPAAPSQRTILGNRLAELVEKDLWLVSTGFAGTPTILHALASTGNLHHAYRMLQAKDTPSWFAPILLGATTIWERWDSMLQDGRINPGRMTSFNHYALGAVASFLHSVTGGLSPLEQGWKKALIKPQPGGSVTWAKTSFNSPYGEFRCEWTTNGNKLEGVTAVPPNATAILELPGQEPREISSGVRNFSIPRKTDERWPPVEPEGEWVLERREIGWI
ncbi:hypothetical protein CLAIMM_09467 [Cladophialophora immunda]|nr:hypothetical protein CLAIMM_09467 [Cladophialophora immunda]